MMKVPKHESGSCKIVEGGCKFACMMFRVLQKEYPNWKMLIYRHVVPNDDVQSCIKTSLQLKTNLIPYHPTGRDFRTTVSQKRRQKKSTSKSAVTFGMIFVTLVNLRSTKFSKSLIVFSCKKEDNENQWSIFQQCSGKSHFLSKVYRNRPSPKRYLSISPESNPKNGLPTIIFQDFHHDSPG